VRHILRVCPKSINICKFTRKQRPLFLTSPISHDEDHSADENRWITLGKDRAGKFLVAIHTFLEKSEDVCIIRMISARKGTRKEIKQYEGDKP